MNEHGLYHLTGPKKNKKGARVEGNFPTEKSIFDFLGLEYKKPTERKSGKDVVLKSDEPVQEEKTPSPIVISPKSVKKSTKKKSLKKPTLVKAKKKSLKINIKNRKVRVKNRDSELKKNWQMSYFLIQWNKKNGLKVCKRTQKNCLFSTLLWF